MHTTLHHCLLIVLGWYACLAPLTVMAQPTDCGGSITLTTQAEVDAFNCTSVTNLRIRWETSVDDPIINLKNLASLTAVENNLVIDYAADNINNLDGLNNVKTIGGNLIFQDYYLPDFQGLEGLKSIGGSLMLSTVLVDNFNGLNNLLTIGGNFELSNFSVEDDFTGLASLRQIDGIFELSSSGQGGGITGFDNFNGLSGLTSVGGITVRETGLGSFEGLQSLKVIKGDLDLGSDDEGASSFRGLENLEEITGSIFTYSYPDTQPLGNLRRVGGTIWVTSGGINTSGLKKLEEIGSLIITGAGVDLNGLTALRVINGDLTIAETPVKDISILASETIESIGSLTLTLNHNLTSCCDVLAVINKVKGEVIVRNNGIGCDDLEAVEVSCKGGNGVFYTYYEGDWSRLPFFQNETVVNSGTLSNFSLSPAERDDYYGFEFGTYLEVTTPGEYTFFLNSDDGSKLYIDAQLVVDNDGRHSIRERSGTVTLSKGRHSLRVDYFEAFSIERLEVRYAGPGFSKQLIPDEVLFLKDEDAPAVIIVANAGSDRIVSSNVSEPLYLGGSARGPNPFRRYQWEKLSGPSVRMVNQNTANLQLYDLQVGDYTFRFTATDSEGNVGSDEITLTVTGDEPNQPTVSADAGPDRTIRVGVREPFIISGRGIGPNPFRRYRWEQLSGPSIRVEGQTANLSLYDLVIGTYTFRLTATDSEGNSGLDEVTLTVTGGNARLASGTDKSTNGFIGANTELLIYPNPVSNQLNVQVPTPGQQPEVLVMTDLAGKIVRRLAPSDLAGKYSLDVGDVPAGIYLVRWQTDRLHTAKVIIEH